ncbi:hypothetical protein NEUTE1DRAFT_103530 [Neurospora tetrasperma FGSC 2508]|uniref:Uncharacterized protein n=1 Tax=Neurospora tetrasperma (strain FGSC 2508 / ATCC MYA-4615 / P0657) TaxID=510951 RepID=F8MW59_NEUT8|nr:uncharacterized protein NEUTE1DRAFT_103530 [Neurospora tetrasperma FGSC 2508]EGO54054.1 hypothetical protein NEUTE1DRAFT_103530 [Neurospora tetrasperma FGSC 2508]
MESGDRIWIIDRAAAGWIDVAGSRFACKDGTGPNRRAGYGCLGGQLVCGKDDIHGHWSPKGRTAGWMVLCREAPEGEMDGAVGGRGRWKRKKR